MLFGTVALHVIRVCWKWRRKDHPEKIPSARERYKNEILRVLGVLEDVLSKQEWLVAGKLTVADISFVPYVCSLCLTM